MPALGLPDTLENLLATLQTSAGLSSWKICSQDSNTTTVVLRFTGQPLDDTARAPRYYRRKCPSQRKRDQARLQAYIEQRSAKNKFATDQVSDCSNVRQTQSETDIITADPECDTVMTSDNRPTHPVSPPASPSGLFAPSPQTETVTDTMCHDNSAHVDLSTLQSVSSDQPIISAAVSEGNIPFHFSDFSDRCDSATHKTDSDVCGVEQLARDAGFDVDDIKTKVGSVFDRKIQASLRDKSNNRDFHRIVVDDDSDCFVCQSDDFVFMFERKTGDCVKWFIINHHAKRTETEIAILSNIKQWQTVERRSYPVCNRISTDLGIVSAFVRSILG